MIQGPGALNGDSILGLIAPEMGQDEFHRFHPPQRGAIQNLVHAVPDLDNFQFVHGTDFEKLVGQIQKRIRFEHEEFHESSPVFPSSDGPSSAVDAIAKRSLGQPAVDFSVPLSAMVFQEFSFPTPQRPICVGWTGLARQFALDADEFPSCIASLITPVGINQAKCEILRIFENGFKEFSFGRHGASVSHRVLQKEILTPLQNTD